MRIITKRRIQEFHTRHPSTRAALEAWHDFVSHAKWRSIWDVRVLFPHADIVKVASGRIVTVFNIGGNKARLVAAIHYNTQVVYILAIMTHAEYGKERWKENL